ncbi:hypothetical protein [Kitasatospora sp. NPDC051914]|uniref:hypothetical protein n=1 Tax=Kitasatospora sp. NPDC051914 TaxID=3154945 RepID=UPI00343F90A6
MDMPFNIVPAPFGAFVALYLSTPDEEAAKKHDIACWDSGEPLLYELQPVVGWCYFEDERGDITNLPMVVDTYGMQVAINFDSSWTPPKSVHVAHGMERFDGICTLLEAERRVGEIAEEMGVQPARWGACGFSPGNGDRFASGLRPDFRL